VGDPYITLENGKLTVKEAELSDNHSGWSEVELTKEINNFKNRVSIVTKFEKQSGFIRHSGFIKGSA